MSRNPACYQIYYDGLALDVAIKAMTQFFDNHNTVKDCCYNRNTHCTICKFHHYAYLVLVSLDVL